MSIDKTAYIADGVKIVGDGIAIGAESSVWYNTVIRCDEGRTISIGSKTNIQDLCMLHTAPDCSVTIGDGVTVGHMCLIHGCTIGDNTLIGMGSIIMDGAVIGSNCIIGAGSLVTEGKTIPDGSLAFGRPAKVVGEVSEQQIIDIINSVELYAEETRKRL